MDCDIQKGVQVKNIFKSQDTKEIQTSYTRLWAEMVNRLEKNKTTIDGRGDRT